MSTTELIIILALTAYAVFKQTRTHDHRQVPVQARDHLRDRRRRPRRARRPQHRRGRTARSEPARQPAHRLCARHSVEDVALG